MEMVKNALIERTKLFSQQVDTLKFSCDCYIYNPLDYAWQMHEAYLRRYLAEPVKTVLLGMNPGPFGMAQNGVPFGEVHAVRDFLHLDMPIGKPLSEHLKRPVLGMQIQRSEVSGKRLWGLLQGYYKTADAMIGQMGVINYCPLVFIDRKSTAKNITPDKLPKTEQLALQTICNSYLLDVIDILNPTYLIGVGLYATQKLESVLQNRADFTIGRIIHPSGGNPQANSGWNEKTTAVFRELGIWNS